MKSQSSTVLRVGLLRCLGGSSKRELRSFYWASSPEKNVFRSVTSKPRRNYHVEQRYIGSSPKCWSILSSSSLAISSRLSSWKRRGAKVDENRTLLLVILVTPAHLSLLEDGNAFIPDLLRQEAELSQPGQVFDVMAAVVDRIPHPCAPTEGSGSMASNSSAGATTRDGSEGVSVAVLDSSSAAPTLWATQQDSQERETMTIQQRCTLAFTIPSSTCADIEVQKLARQDVASRMLQLPVANTVFQNGRTATLFAQRWILQQEHQSNALLVPEPKVWLPQQALNLNGLTKETSVDQSLHSDLTPITPPRTIKAAIGNIIRKVSAGGSPEADIPASNELERAITTGIRNGSIPDQPAEVWALVKPRGYAPHLGCEIIEVSPELDELHKALLSGCRLHKVLSGGGGWGEKQGLLALDPDSSYSPRQQAFQLSTGDEQDTEAEKLQALGEVVKPGDVVTFYVRNPSLAQTNTLNMPDFVAHSSLAPLSLIFGSLPSTMDVMPGLLPTKTTAEESDCVILEGCFGMLSEQGMSLTSTFNSSGIDNVTTKLDAPYTLFTIRARSMAPHSEEVNHFDVRSCDEDGKKTTNSQVNATSAANARMSAANRGSAKMSFWNGITQRLQGLSPDIPKIGAIPVRPFATNSHCYSQARFGKSQAALFEAEAEAEAASLEQQLQHLQIPTVALNGVDDNSAGFAEKIAKLRPQLRALKSNPSKSEDPEAQAPSGGRVRLRVVRSQKRHASMAQSRVRYIQRNLTRYIPTKPIVTRSLVAADEKPQAKPGVEDEEPHGRQKYFRQVTDQPPIRRHVSNSGPLGRYVNDGQRFPPPVDMMFRKVNPNSAVMFRKVNPNSAENNASESQLEIGKYHKSEAGEGTKTSGGPRKNAIDPSAPIRFISDTETEDAHIEVPNELGLELSEKSIELDVEPIEIRRHLSSGQAPKLPFTVRRIRRVPGFHVSKHTVADRMVTTPEGYLLIRKHEVGPMSEERPSGLSHSTSAPETQKIKPDSPKDKARELHSKYSFTSLNDISPKSIQKPREQYFTFRKHKTDAKLPIFVQGSS